MSVTRQWRHVLGQWAVVIFLGLITAIPAWSQPVVVFNNFGPGDSTGSPDGTGQPITGSDQAVPRDLAISFTTDNNAYLVTSVTVPIAPTGPPPTLPIFLQLRTDNGGVPSETILDSLFSTEIPLPGTGNKITWNPNNVTLAPNTTYWLAALAGAPTTVRFWELNNQGQAGLAQNLGSGWVFAAPPATPVARIVGVQLAAAPEPATLALLGTALGFVVLRYRGRFR